MTLFDDDPKKALYTRPAFESGLWLFIQQLVVASSTFFIIRVMENLKEPTFGVALSYLVLFVISLTIVYLPTAASEVQLEKAIFASRDRYLKMFVKINKGRRTFTRAHYKREYQAWIANESGVVFQEASELIYQAFATFLNATLNVIVIAVVIDSRFIPWYVGAAILLFIASRLSQKILITASLRLQKTRKSLTDHLLRAWDNVIIGNDHNLDLWSAQHTKHLAAAESATVKNTVIRAIISSLTVIAAILVIGSGMGIYIAENKSNFPALAALVVTFPRQIQVLQSVFYFFGHILEWHGVSARLEGLRSPLQLHHKVSPTSFIHLNQINFSLNDSKVDIYSVDDFILKISTLKNGRFTIRGQNGSGKSTLLAHLCEELGDGVFFLPSSSLSLVFRDSQIGIGSDGQNASAILEELLDIPLPKIIAIDELDASLDNKSIRQFHKKLAVLSKQHVLIEIRHR